MRATARRKCERRSALSECDIRCFQVHYLF
jgi:hypothetical protein